LLNKNGRKIPRMEAVPHLKTFSAKSDVAQRLASQPGINPKGKNALIRATQLSGSGQHPPNG